MPRCVGISASSLVGLDIGADDGNLRGWIMCFSAIAVPAGEQRIDKSEAAAIAVLTEQVSAGGRIGVVRDLN